MIWLAQCLCGPNRHTLAGLCGEFPDEEEASRNLLPQLREAIAGLLDGQVNPWCAICGSREATWRYELAVTCFGTMDEALPELARLAAENAEANRLFGTHGPNPPRKH